MPQPTDSPAAAANPIGNENPGTERVPLDPRIAQRLWESRYRKELKQYAYKNAFLNDFKDPEDLFQDMIIDVWMKAVALFDMSKVSYTQNLEQAFNALFTTTLIGYLDNLKKHRGTGKQQWEQKLKSMDSPQGGGSKSSDNSEEGRELGDSVADALSDPHMVGDLKRVLDDIDPALREPLEYIMDELERGGTVDIWNQIREQFTDPSTGKGWTKTRFLNSLMEEPAFTEWAVGVFEDKGGFPTGAPTSHTTVGYPHCRRCGEDFGDDGRCHNSNCAESVENKAKREQLDLEKKNKKRKDKQERKARFLQSR